MDRFLVLAMTEHLHPPHRPPHQLHVTLSPSYHCSRNGMLWMARCLKEGTPHALRPPCSGRADLMHYMQLEDGNAQRLGHCRSITWTKPADGCSGAPAADALYKRPVDPVQSSRPTCPQHCKDLWGHSQPTAQAVPSAKQLDALPKAAEAITEAAIGERSGRCRAPDSSDTNADTDLLQRV